MPENTTLTTNSEPTSNAHETNLVQPASCGCGGKKAPSAPPQKVYALGQIDYDFGSEANRDVFQQLGVSVPENRAAMAQYLTQFDEGILGPYPSRPNVEPGSSAANATIWSWEQSVKERLRRSQEPFPNQAFAERLNWVLVQDGTPIYAIQPMGAFAKNGYARLAEFLDEQTSNSSDMVSLPGQVYGQVRLLNGMQVPVVIPDLRGLCNWSSEKLVASASTPADSDSLREELLNYLHRTYFEIRNLGITSRDRAINFAATNILQVKNVFAQAIRNTILQTQLKLESIDAERSANCRPGADCWDIKLTFFDPAKRLEAPKQVFRFTIDVSEALPVSIGPIRSWFTN